jgi:hypothetical protein
MVSHICIANTWIYLWINKGGQKYNLHLTSFLLLAGGQTVILNYIY